MNNNYTENNFISVSLAGSQNGMTCLVCGDTKELYQTDQLKSDKAFGADSGHGSLRVVNTSKKHLDVFKKKHLVLHWPEKYAKEKATARRDGMVKRFDSKTGQDVWG